MANAVSKFIEEPCVCDLIQSLGSFKSTLIALIDTFIAYLTAIKAAALLWPNDPADRVEMLAYDVAIKALETAIKPIDVPFVLVTSYFKNYSDCTPIATASKTLNDTKKLLTGWAKDYMEEWKQKQEQLDMEGTKIDRLNLVIDQLKDFKDAIELCNV